MRDKDNISDFDRGYWCAIQDVLCSCIRPDRALLKELIRTSGLTRDQCLKLIGQNSFYGNILKEIIDDVFPKRPEK